MSIQVLKRPSVVSAGEFADEEVTTDFGLPKQWDGADSIDEQIGNLSDLLKTKPNAKTKKFLREGLPAWFELEWPEWIDGFFACFNPLVDYHVGLSEKIIPALAEKFTQRGWSFTNYRKGQLGSDRLRLNAQTTAAYKKMAKIQEGNFWIIPMSLANGKRHPGKTASPRRYLELAGLGEFGVGPSEGLCAALIHFDKRIQPGNVFRMDFPGAKYDHPGADERWTHVPYLYWSGGGGAYFDASHAGGCDPRFASALGRLPQR